MSRGHGTIMRGIIAHVGDEWIDMIDLLWLVFKKQPDGLWFRAEREAVRRACKRLAEDGELEIAYRYVSCIGKVFYDPADYRGRTLVVRKKPKC